MKIDLEILSDSFSIVGTKECYLSDKKDEVFYFHDTGGIFGDRKHLPLTRSQFPSHAGPIVLTGGSEENPQQVIGKVTFGEEHVVFSCASVDRFLAWVAKVFPKNGYMAIYMPASLNSADAKRFIQAFDPSNDAVSETWPSGAPEALINELSTSSTLPLSITRSGNRIQLKTLYLDACELPVEALPVEVTDNKLVCLKRLLLGSIQISGFSVSFPTSAIAEAYAKRLGLLQQDSAAAIVTAAQPSDTLISQVRVHGSVLGAAMTVSECDAELGASELILREPGSNKLLARFDFKSPSLSVDGTPSSFVISNDHGTVLHVSARSEAFLRAVFDNDALRSAAHRAANTGPFLGSAQSGELIRLEVNKDGLQLFFGNRTASVPTVPEALPRLEVEHAEPRLTLGDLTLSAQLPMLEGIAAAASAPYLRNRVHADFHGCVSLLVGMEAKYFAYSSLGKLAESQLLITSASAIPAWSRVAAMASEYERGIFLTFVLQHAGRVARDLETTINQLPAFATATDSEFLAGIGLASALNTKNIEAAYQRAVAPVLSLVSHLYKLESCASRLASVRRALAESDGWTSFIPLGLSISASLVNPLFFLGAAQQGASLFTRTEARAATEQDSVRDAFENGACEWDHIIQSLLPFASYRLCRELHPIRLNVSALLLSAYEKGDVSLRDRIEFAVAERFARLTTFLDFPSAFDKNVPRHRVSDLLFHLHSRADAFGLRHF